MDSQVVDVDNQQTVTAPETGIGTVFETSCVYERFIESIQNGNSIANYTKMTNQSQANAVPLGILKREYLKFCSKWEKQSTGEP